MVNITFECATVAAHGGHNIVGIGRVAYTGAYHIIYDI